MASVDVTVALNTVAAMRRLVLIVAASAWTAAGLVGCERDAGPKVERKVEDATQSAERATADFSANAREAGRAAGEAFDKAAAVVAEKSREVAGDVKDASRDIAITGAIKARLASDARLSALRIDVETDDGHVTLRGTAPDTASRSHATELAGTVQGVRAVINDLSVQRQP